MELTEVKKVKRGIPTDWALSTIEDLCKTFTKQTGFDYSKHIKPTLIEKKQRNTYPFIQNKDFDGNYVNFDTDYHIPCEVAERFPRIFLNERCLLISISGSIGKVGVFNNNEKAFIGGAVAVGKFFNPKLLDWVMYYLKSNAGQNLMLKDVKAGSHQNLILDDIRKMEIPMPSYEEQQAIATALSDVDELISSLDKLITKKKAIKQGAMQQLLTPPHKGGKRLEGFTGEWEDKTIESLVVKNGLIRGPFGGALKKEFFVSKGYKVYEQKNAIYKSVELGEYFIDDIKFKELKRFEVNQGDYILSCSGTIGKLYQIPPNHPIGIINQALLIIRIDKSISDYSYFEHQFTSDVVQQNVIDDTQGGAMKNLVGMSDFKKATIPYPPTLEEQKAIAEILSDIDKDIEQLETKKAKYQAVKQGMMQELLTGKTRLV